MPSGRSTNTMVESLQNVLKDISQMKTMPDANLEFLVELETMILSFLRKPIEDYMAASMGGSTGGNPGSTTPGAPPANGPSFAGAGVPGMMSGPGGRVPSEELTRLLG